MTSLTDSLEEIEKRLKAASPGPWTSGNHVGTVELTTHPDCCDDPSCAFIAEIVYGCRGTEVDEHNSSFIAHAPTDIAKLLIAVRIAREALESVANGRCPYTLLDFRLTGKEAIRLMAHVLEGDG